MRGFTEGRALRNGPPVNISSLHSCEVVQYSNIMRFLIHHMHILPYLPDTSGPFAPERSHDTKSPKWGENDTLGHVKQSQQI